MAQDNRNLEVGGSVDPRWDQQPSVLAKDRLLKPYLVRPLNAGDFHRLEQARADPNQFELTRTLLSQDAFKPTNMLTIGERKFMVGRVINGQYLIMFYEDPNTKKLFPRVVVSSQSGRSWRSTPGEGGDSRGYSKGTNIHYVQEAKAHTNIVRYADEAMAAKYSVGFRDPDLGGSVTEKYFHLGSKNSKKPEWYTFDQEISKYDDKGVLRQFQQYPPGYLDKKSFGENANISVQFRNFDFSTPELKAFLPDFTKPPVAISTLEATFLGKVRLETYLAQLNGRPIEWVMAYDTASRVWVDRIAFLDREVNSYGIIPEVIDSGCLTNKPFEYTSAIGALKAGEEYFMEPNLGYEDITPLLDNLLPIKQFRRARNIDPERISRAERPITIETAKTFHEFQIALSRVGRLKASTRKDHYDDTFWIIRSIHDLTADPKNHFVNPKSIMDCVPDEKGLRDAVRRIAKIYTRNDVYGPLDFVPLKEESVVPSSSDEIKTVRLKGTGVCGYQLSNFEDSYPFKNSYGKDTYMAGGSRLSTIYVRTNGGDIYRFDDYDGIVRLISRNTNVGRPSLAWMEIPKELIDDQVLTVGKEFKFKGINRKGQVYENIVGVNISGKIPEITEIVAVGGSNYNLDVYTDMQKWAESTVADDFNRQDLPPISGGE